MINHRKIRLLTLLICLALTVGLRLYNLPNRIRWGGDEARDLLVGLHLANYGENLIIGHISSWTGLGFYYPPYYYYLVALVTKLNQNPIFVYGVFTIFESLTVLSVYFIAKYLFSNSVAILASFVFAVTSSLVEKGSVVWPAYVVIPIVGFGISLILFSGRHKNYFYLPGFALLVFATTIHYAAIIALFIILVVFLFKTSWLNRFISLWALLVFSFVLYLPLTLAFGAGYMFKNILMHNHYNSSVAILSNLAQGVTMSWMDLFDFDPVKSLENAIVILILTFFILFSGNPRFISKALPIFIFIVTFFVAGSLNNGGLMYHYFVLTHPAIIILISMIMVEAFRRQRVTVLKGAIFLLSFFVVSSLINNFSQSNKIRNDFEDSRQIAAYVKKSAKDLGFGNKYIIAASNPELNYYWLNPTILYFLETRNEPMIKLVNYGNNMIPLAKLDSPFFVICKNYQYSELPLCQSKFESVYNNFYLSRELPGKVPNYTVFVYLKKELN